MKHGKLIRMVVSGWWEEYRCGCVSKTEKWKKDLLGYCATHGDCTRSVIPERKIVRAQKR